MIPTDVFVSGDILEYLTPDDQTESSFISFERGGVALSDPSQGINSYTWTSSYNALSGTITLTNVNTGVPYVFVTGFTGLTSLSFAFDANMRPVLGYTNTVGASFIYFYDTVTEDYLEITLPAGSMYPKCCHDDKRDTMVQINKSDVLVFYLRNGIGYYRLQRELYNVERRVFTVTPDTVLEKVGMTKNLKLQLKLSNGSFISSP
jgi:hypothetical protein